MQTWILEVVQKVIVKGDLDEVGRVVVLLVVAVLLAPQRQRLLARGLPLRRVLAVLVVVPPQHQEMLPLLLDEEEENVELGVQLIPLTIVFLDQLLLIDLQEVVVLVNLRLPDVLPLGLLVLGLGDAVLHGDLLVELLEEVFDDVHHLRLLLLVQLLLLFLEVLVLGVLFVALGQSWSIKHIILLQKLIILILRVGFFVSELLLKSSNSDLHRPEISLLVTAKMVIVLNGLLADVLRVTMLN